MCACSLGASASHRQIPGQQNFVREWWNRVPDAGAAVTHVLSGEPAPSAVPARKHHDGGEEPRASGKRAAVRIHRGPRRLRRPDSFSPSKRWVCEGLHSLRRAGPLYVWGLRKSRKWRGFIIIKLEAPAASAGPIPEKVRNSRAGSGPRTWPAGLGQARSRGRPA